MRPTTKGSSQKKTPNISKLRHEKAKIIPTSIAGLAKKKSFPFFLNLLIIFPNLSPEPFLEAKTCSPALIPSLGGTGRSESFRTKRLGRRGTDRRQQLRNAKVPSTGPKVDQLDLSSRCGKHWMVGLDGQL